ncbi:hypothetical protein IPJ91_00455 [bacterium]|nr:MAG: hypothetical protein IPJ91_00455 [bacterium]
MDIKTYKKKALRTDWKTYNDFHTGKSSPRLDYGVIGLSTSSCQILDLIKKAKRGKTMTMR